MGYQELRDIAEPGPWRDKLEAVIAAEAAHRSLFARNKASYDRFYDTPEPMRGQLPEGVAADVEEIEASSVAFGQLRDGIQPALVAAFVAKAATLGAGPVRDDEPLWLKLMVDLHELRQWRVAHLDQVDLHLPPFLLRRAAKGEPTPMFDQAFAAWSKAVGVRTEVVRGHVVELAGAGVLPGVANAPERHGFEVDGDAGRFALLVEKKGADRILAELRLAAEILPATSFPVPEAAIAELTVGSGPRP